MASADPSNQRVLISYTAPPTFVATPNWKKVQSTIIAQLPLRNIHWKSASRSFVRTIQELDVTLVPFESLRDEHVSQVPTTLLEKPLLHLYILHCEDNDLETYRNSLKRYVKEWHTSVTSRRNQEWLILQIIRPDPSRSQAGKLFQIKNSVLDKLKTDFNLDKRDRCMQLNWHTGTDNPLAWAEFVNKMKEGVIYAFDAAIAQREEEVKRSENQQSMPGWNFCTFFILKESLASSFEGMNLFEEAIIPYDELEAMFHRLSKERNMFWLGSFIHPDFKNHDSQPLLSVTNKPYRDLILANTIAVLDFRIYLLARQCRLLAKMAKFSEITTMIGFFLASLGKQLQEIENLPPYFIEEWIYSSALSAVEQCDVWMTEFKIDSSKFTSANSGKAELLDIARSQLDIFGIAASHLPASPPFSISLSTKLPLPSIKDVSLSNQTLNAAVNNRNAFYELYVAVTNRAVDLYAKSGRRKFALKLHGCLAAFELHRGNLTRALNTFISLPAHYSPHAWTSLEALMLQRALHTHDQLEQSHDTEWVHLVLSFLKAHVEHHNDDLMYDTEHVEYVSRLVESLRKSVEELENDIVQPDHPALSITCSSDVRLASTRDGCYLDVVVQNRLPCTLPVENASVTIIGRDLEKLRYDCLIDKGFPPGPSSHALFCPTSSAGSFVLETSEFRFSRLIFQLNHRKSSTKQTGKLPFFVRVPQDLLALDVRISQSRKIILGKPQSLTVVLFMGRNHIRKAFIRLSSPSEKPSATFRCGEAILEDDGGDETILFRATEGAVVVEDIEDDTKITFSVPHSDSSALNAMKVSLEVEYTTLAEPSLTRTSRFSRILITTLPISVNVEDFFRGTRLISKFTVSTTSYQHVRIEEARLDLPPGGLDGVRIQPASNHKRVITVTPLQPANFLFSLDSSKGPVRESLILSIKYRMLREEVEDIIEQEVKAVLEGSPLSLHNRIILVGKLIEALESDAGWVKLYGITGELIVPITHDKEDEIGELLKKVKKRLADHKHPNPPAGRWREIQIPVDVPFMNIIAAARIQILSTPFTKGTRPDELPSLYAGQPISAHLMIHTSFHWGHNPNDTNPQYLLRFNIEEIVQEWLVSGPKRGDFVAMDDATHTVPITLIALHHGEFSLPKVSVTALPMSGSVTMGSLAIPSIETYQIHGAERVLVLPRGGRSTFIVGMGPG